MADDEKKPKKRDESIGRLFRRKRGIEEGTMEGKTVVGGPVQTTAESTRVDTPEPKPRKVRSTPASRKAKKQKRKFSF